MLYEVITMTDIYEGQQSFDLLLRYQPYYTNSIDGIKKALIDCADGNKVMLEQVAKVVSVAGPGSISREDVQRKIVVSANVSGQNLNEVVDQIQA